MKPVKHYPYKHYVLKGWTTLDADFGEALESVRSSHHIIVWHRSLVLQAIFEVLNEKLAILNINAPVDENGEWLSPEERDAIYARDEQGEFAVLVVSSSQHEALHRVASKISQKEFPICKLSEEGVLTL